LTLTDSNYLLIQGTKQSGDETVISQFLDALTPLSQPTQIQSMPPQPRFEDENERAAAYGAKEYFDMLFPEKTDVLTAASMQVVMKLLGMQWIDEVGGFGWRTVQEVQTSKLFVCVLQEREQLVGGSGMSFAVYRDLMSGGKETTGETGPEVLLQP